MFGSEAKADDANTEISAYVASPKADSDRRSVLNIIVELRIVILIFPLYAFGGYLF
jgi:hypothetical protein